MGSNRTDARPAGDRRVRPPAVAGTFYPADPVELAADVDALLAAASPPLGAAPKALVVPHAGYVYSGPVAATAYATLRRAAEPITRVVLLGPAHRTPVHGLALSSAAAFATPLGEVAVDDDLRRAVSTLPGITVDDDAHALEHSLEVHLPFLQRILDDRAGGTDWSIVPMVVGRADAGTVAEVLDALWGGAETVVVVSSDLSHYLDLEHARARDRRTAAAIVERRIDDLEPADACGAAPLRGLLVASARRGIRPTLLDLRTSGDTAGPHDRVVGYGAFALAAA